MGRIISLRDLIGAIKDKISFSKAIIVSAPQTISLHLAVLRATTRSPSTPPDVGRISTLFSLGDGSRTTASFLISTLMDRLHRTGNSAVALKCLLIIHKVIKSGPFILQDQFSVLPATGGQNYLKMSDFRDGTTAFTWVLSSWVRWYARYIETLLSTSRVFGYFLCSYSCTVDKEKQEERMSLISNDDLIKDVNLLIGVMEEICEVPDPHFVDGNKLLYEVIGLLCDDYLSIVCEILSRLGQLNQRVICLSNNDSVELKCAIKRLEDCKEKLSVLFKIKKPSMEALWALIDELKKKVSEFKSGKEGRMLLRWG